jgi:D-alanyl-D-alanine carboxypeptidase/D-alanyl-D-alanine-endopeptidase (penicillin-binding protein 4)
VATLAASTACASHTPVARPGQQPPVGAKTSQAVRQLRSDLNAIFGAPIMARGTWAVDIRSLATGERLYDLGSTRLMMPASNMKIVTAAVAAEKLGWDFRFTTALQTHGTIEGGVLTGDLIVRGGGDPTINGRGNRAAAVFDDWARALRDAGIQRISGRIVGDDQAFDDEGLGAGWAWDYLQYGYAAPSGALQYNEDVAQLAVEPGAAAGDAAIVRLAPGSGLVLLNHITTGAAGTPQAIEYRRHPEAAVVELTGTIPLGLERPLTRDLAVVNPTVFFAQSLKDGLIARGIEVAGPAVDLDDIAAEFAGAGDRRTLVETRSAPLTEVATVLMKVSQNLYAETFLKALGAARGGLGTTDGGRAVVRQTLSSWGIPEDGYVQVDGSGLSRYDYVTAGTIVEILQHLYRDTRHRDAFMATLPIAGRDGTIASRLKRTRAEGNAIAKTGSIANVRSLSGYVKTRDGEMLVFSILANDFVIPPATVNWISDLAVETLANFTGR